MPRWCRTYAEQVAPGWWRRETALPVQPLVVDVVLALASMYAAFLLTSEVLATLAGRGSAEAAHAVALLHGASVAFRRLAPLPALAVLLGTAGAFGFVLGLPIYMLGPAVLFVAYALGSEFPRRQALVLLASAYAGGVLGAQITRRMSATVLRSTVIACGLVVAVLLLV